VGLFATLFLAMGIFSIAGALGKWDILLNSKQGQALQKRFGPRKTRIFYVAVGIALVIMSGIVFWGVIQEQQ
jgi:hypothetical protein